MRSTLKVAMMAASLMMFGGKPGIAADTFGAIAFAPTTGSYGFGHKYASRSKAEARAMQECRARGGDCRIVVWFRNACGALATGQNGFGSGWGSNLDLAKDEANNTCERYTSACSVKAWVCSGE